MLRSTMQQTFIGYEFLEPKYLKVILLYFLDYGERCCFFSFTIEPSEGVSSCTPFNDHFHDINEYSWLSVGFFKKKMIFYYSAIVDIELRVLWDLNLVSFKKRNSFLMLIQNNIICHRPITRLYQPFLKMTIKFSRHFLWNFHCFYFS